MQYITLLEASRLYNCTYINLYMSVQRKVLKAVKVNGVLHTTLEWMIEYSANLNNREKVSRFNGKLTFDPSRQEYSTKKAAEILGIKKRDLYKLIYKGELKSFRKGSYHIITQESIENYINKVEVIEYEYVC